MCCVVSRVARPHDPKCSTRRDMKRSSAAHTEDDDAKRAASWLIDADVIVLAAGAGMGVDSGFGTFRGAAAKALHPVLDLMGLTYQEVCSIPMLKRLPRLYWAAWAEMFVFVAAPMP